MEIVRYVAVERTVWEKGMINKNLISMNREQKV